MQLYRKNLKRLSGLKYAADLAVPHPTHERTWFRLVVGGHNSTVLEVFRDVEGRVMGSEAAVARTSARQRAGERAGQGSLFSVKAEVPDADPRYARMKQEARELAVDQVLGLLQGRSMRWEQIWPSVLEELHLPLSDLRKIVVDAAKNNKLSIDPAPARTAIRPHAVVRAGSRTDESP